jgi:hypothetical protein
LERIKMEEEHECSKCGFMNPYDVWSCLECGNDEFKPNAENKKIFEECNRKISKLIRG